MSIDDKTAQSAWRATANSTDEFESMEGDHKVDVAIIGGGLTGLSAARDLMDRSVSCSVLEARDIGFGASGRSGGFCVPRYKKSFVDIASEYGNDMARHLHQQVIHAVDSVDSTVNRFSIDCDWQRRGHLTTTCSDKGFSGLKSDVDWLRKEAKDFTPQILNAEETWEKTGSSFYKGSYHDLRGGCIHPYNYVRGLAKSLNANGIGVYRDTPVISLSQNGSNWLVETPKGNVIAEKVIIATNGYGTRDLFKGDQVYRRVIPVASSIVATRPLTPLEEKKTIPCGLPVSDNSRVTSYLRKLPNGQLLFGGRGDLNGSDDPASFLPIEKRLEKIFPFLSGIDIQERWFGKVAVSLDAFPHIGEVAPGVFYGLGYGGRGIALTSLLGSRLASSVVGERLPQDPMVNNSFRPIPFHRFRRLGMQIMVRYYGALDKFEQVGFK